MRVSSLKSIDQTKLAGKIVRPRSNLALAHINVISSDSSSDEQQPTCSSSYKHSFDECLLHPNNLKVAAVLRTTLRGQPKEALKFFYSRREAGFQHNIQNYVEIVRMLCCRQRTDSRLNDIILEVVNLGNITLSFGISELFQAVVENIEDEEGKLDLLNRVSGAFVKSCATLGLFGDAVHVLFQTRKPCTSSCNALINRLIKHHKVDEAVALYPQLKRLGFTPNVYTYNLLVKAYCRRGSIEEAAKVVDEMEGAGINPDEFTCYPFIEWHCLNGRSDFGYRMLEKACEEENIAFSNISYAVVIRGFCNEMNFQKAEDVLRYIGSQGLIPDAQCFKALIHAYCKCSKFQEASLLHEEMMSKGVRYAEVFFDAVSYNVLLDALCKSGKLEEAKRFFTEIPAPDLIHYSTLINGYCLEGNIVQALNVFGEMRSKGLEPDAVLCNILLGALYRNGYEKTALNLLMLMQAQGLRLNSLSQKTIIESICVGGNVKEAESYFNGLEEKNTEVCSAMVSGYCDANHTMKAYELSSHLSQQQGIVVDKKSQFKLVSKLLEEGNTRKAFSLYQSCCLRLENVRTRLKMCSKIMVAFCKAGDMRNAQSVFDCWVKRGLIPDSMMYTIMIDGYCKAYLIPEAYELFYHMKARGIGPDIVTYTVLIDGCVKSCLESPELRPSIVQKICALQSEMEEEKIEADVVCYTVLIDKLCRFNDLDGAFDIMERMMARGLKPDFFAFTALYFGCCRNGDARALGFIDMIKNTGLIDEMKKEDSGRVVFFDTLERGIIHLNQHYPHLFSVEDLEKYMAVVKDFCQILSVTG